MKATAFSRQSFECRAGGDSDLRCPNGCTRAQTLKHRWKKGMKTAERGEVKACFAGREKNKVLCDKASGALDLLTYPARYFLFAHQLAFKSW